MPTEEMEVQKKIFSKNLRDLLTLKGKSQTDLSRYIRVSAATVSEWIHGKKMPRMDKIQSIANWLNVNKSDLLEAKEVEIDVQSQLIEKYLQQSKLRELLLFAGGVEPEEARDQVIDAVISALSALRKGGKT